jgi:hypothetical protein
MTAIEAIDALLAKEHTLRENRRIKIALNGAPLLNQDARRLRLLIPTSLDKTASWRSPSWSSSIVVKSYTSSARLERVRAICRSRSAFKPSRLAVASIHATQRSRQRARQGRA